MNGDFPELEEAIGRYQARVTSLKARLAELEVQVPFWKARWDSARDFAKRLDPNAIAWANWPVYYNISGAGLGYLNSWGGEAVEGLADYRGRLERFAREPTGAKEVREEIIYMEEERLGQIIEHTRENPDLVGGLSIFELARRLGVVWPSKHNFRIHKWHSTFRAYVSDLVARAEGGLFDYDRSRWGIKYIAWVTPTVGDSWRPRIAEQINLAQETYWSLYTELQNTRVELEMTIRALRDAELALESAELEKRRAEALEEAERLAAEERRRIELDSIARDLMLGYPEMDAATARIIAVEAYQAAIGAIEGRYIKALEIARERARLWAQKEQIPGEPTFGPVVGVVGWLEKNWPYLVIAGLGTGLAISLARRK